MSTGSFQDGWNASELRPPNGFELHEQRDPLLALPPELVAEIFVHFLPSYPERPPPSGLVSPLLLCLVCRQWRDIALSTPTLWRAIQIDLNESGSQEMMDWKLQILSTWLSRSGDCPLSVSLRYHIEYRPPAPPPPSPQFLRTLVAHCKRWEHIELVMPFEQLHLIEGEMPLLRHLTFGPSDLPPDTDDEGHTVLTLFDRAPQLTSVVLTDCFVTSSLRLPWTQITHLDGRCLYEHECTEILRDADHLVHCTLNVCEASEPSFLIHTVPSHAHLRHLVLLVTGPSDVHHVAILDSVTLPALRTLWISEAGLGKQLVRALEAFISRSRCTLENLHIDKSLFSEMAYYAAIAESSVRTITVVPK
ncbi:hypothetical protein FB451DRAFT_283145 [Mycena latifolia]|nr:hypothetical protein FB451DRAFT_283145 [Mycena latifolia]